MKFKKTYDNIISAFAEFKAPYILNDQCSKLCPFYPFQEIFDVSCAGFCVDHPKEAAKIMVWKLLKKVRIKNVKARIY